MTTSNMVAAKTLCKISDWSLSNLRLQKILYFAHRRFLWETGNPLVEGPFVRYPYGPVIEEVHHHVKKCGRYAVPEDAFGVHRTLEVETPEYGVIKREYEERKEQYASSLITESHIPRGAWDRCSNENKREIPNDYIKEEHDACEKRR